MTLALSKPEIVDDIVSVDNAPVDATLNNTFAKYIQGMRKIEEAGVTSQGEADKILREFEPVSAGTPVHVFQTLTMSTRNFQYVNSSSGIYTNPKTARRESSASLLGF